MLIKIAWRNVWRSKVRSGVVILAIALGLWAGIFMMGFSWGMYEQRINYAIQNEVGHFQLHHPDFKENNDIKYVIPQSEEVFTKLESDNKIKSYAPRTIVMGMIASANATTGVKISGVFPEKEQNVSHLSDKLIEGDYFESIKRNPIIISKKTSEKLKLGLRSKVVITFQNQNGDITAAAFRIAGIYQSDNAKVDELNVYVKSSDLQKIIGIDAIHEVAILINDNKKLDTIVAEYQSSFPNILVQSWKKLMPEMEFATDTFDQAMGIIFGIIMLALAFGIINTMLMAILERTRELGTLMAIGMNKTKIFIMIVLETIYLTTIGAPFGLFIGWLFIKYFGIHGIDLSVMKEGLSSFGMGSVVYTNLDSRYYLQIMMQVIVVALLASIFPARRALKLNPIESIRKI